MKTKTLKNYLTTVGSKNKVNVVTLGCSKNIFLILFVFVLTADCFGQNNNPKGEIKSDIASKLNLKGYSEITEFYNRNGKVYSRDTLVKYSFLKSGNIQYSWKIIPDIVYMLDSTVFVYNNEGYLISKERFTVADPFNQLSDEQKDMKIPTTSKKIDYVYNDRHQKEYTTTIGEWDKNKMDTTWYEYDSSGNLISQIKNNEKTVYEYNNGKLVKEVETIAELDFGVVKEMPRSYISNYKYDKKGRLEEIYVFVNNNDDKYETQTKFIYNDSSQIVERKLYRNKKCTYIEKYEYLENGLLLSAASIDVKTGLINMKDVRVYEYFK